MSATTALRAALTHPRPATAPAQAPARPRLSVVPAPASTTAGRLPFVLAVGAVLATGLVLLLLLHTLAAQDGFTVHSLQAKSASLADQEQQLAYADLQAQSPAQLAARAKALGMVQATSIAVTQRHGRPVAVLEGFAPAPAPSPSASASPSASPSPSPSHSAATSPVAKQPTTSKTAPAVRPSPKATHH